ncbi:hypothetical protein HF263_23735 [Rhizobium leguminosarum]|uniref:hypothetical protein n=1 Tax=Rhizobium leguminosarum TaxID=384 RepID=UPI0004773025|nr:hypothetical protein [Rhizobium leguminosarum]MBY2994144.1 hypothetical protein [Rhizobium leguminosarum]MBY3059062.1 hypothetical protein [Rhizobium leguminosarum]
MTSRSAPSAPWIYAGLLAAQTAAALTLFWIVFPIFHGLVNHLGERQMLALSDQVGIGASAALLHCFYWIRLKWVPVTSPFHSVFVAHLLFFASRVSFFFGGALFSAIFFRHLPELDALPPFAQACVKSVYVAATLFGLFCYSLELDRFGKAVEDGPPDRGQ